MVSLFLVICWGFKKRYHSEVTKQCDMCHCEAKEQLTIIQHKLNNQKETFSCHLSDAICEVLKWCNMKNVLWHMLQ